MIKCDSSVTDAEKQQSYTRARRILKWARRAQLDPPSSQPSTQSLTATRQPKTPRHSQAAEQVTTERTVISRFVFFSRLRHLYFIIFVVQRDGGLPSSVALGPPSQHLPHDDENRRRRKESTRRSPPCIPRRWNMTRLNRASRSQSQIISRETVSVLLFFPFFFGNRWRWPFSQRIEAV